jgi:hypothetical protein
MFAQKSQETLEKLKEWFARFTHSMEGNKALKHQDAYIRVEYFFRDLLNAVYGWNLANANALKSTDQDSYDLFDSVQGIAIQVTVTTTPAKIRKTLQSFIGTHDNSFKSLKFAYPVMQCPGSGGNHEKLLNGFDFDPKRDRIDFNKILNKVADLPLDQQKTILALVEEQLEPLGRALQFGADDVLDTLITTIKYMTESAPQNELSAMEKDPDYAVKQERLADHIAYLEQQYMVNACLHAAVAQAREAIGYDQVVVAKIQAWLKGESISLLRKHSNDAGGAFDALVEDLLLKSHQKVKVAQKTAVRYLLADEFMRCNVFPNP